MRYLLLIFIVISSQCFSQHDTINENNVKEILSFLASDKMKGRVNYSKEQLQAAEFIADKFKSYGLSAFPGYQYYYQPFITSGKRSAPAEVVKWNGNELSETLYYNFTDKLIPVKKVLSDYNIIKIDGKLSDSILVEHWSDTTPLLIWINKPVIHIDSVFGTSVIIPDLVPAKEILIVVNPEKPETVDLVPREDRGDALLLNNIVGVLQGKSKPEEAIIFSAHYDHVGTGLNGATALYNGANDNASGTTAVLELARYFSMRNDNERTIIFCLFAGEELGMVGSSVFVNNIKPDNVKAVINIEMIGMTNRSGTNSFVVTGAQYSTLETIMRKNLKGDKFKIGNIGFDEQNLFARSDNYPFYDKGIPAHTVMCSDDKEKCYHQDCDDVERINFRNMTLVIKAIAKSCSTIINAADTPKLK